MQPPQESLGHRSQEDSCNEPGPHAGVIDAGVCPLRTRSRTRTLLCLINVQHGRLPHTALIPSMLTQAAMASRVYQGYPSLRSAAQL